MKRFLVDQSGTVSRQQLLADGMSENDVRRLVRRRDLTAIHPGVFVDHTGTPTWLQRAWAAVLYAWPAALGGESALRAADGPGRVLRSDDVTVVIDHARRVRGRPGLVVERRRALDDHVLWNLGPPRLRYEDAAIDVALAAATDLDAVAALAAACGGRRTTARRLAQTVRERSRVPERAWITSVLSDVADGTCSVLEHRYLHDVERAHRLPTARRQLRAVTAATVTYRDVDIAGLVVVELDGRLFHDSATGRDRDMERDLDASLEGRTTVRLGWGQVIGRPCSTAGKIGALLTMLGWAGSIVPCGPSCTASGNIPVTR